MKWIGLGGEESVQRLACAGGQLGGTEEAQDDRRTEGGGGHGGIESRQRVSSVLELLHKSNFIEVNLVFQDKLS